MNGWNNFNPFNRSPFPVKKEDLGFGVSIITMSDGSKVLQVERGEALNKLYTSENFTDNDPKWHNRGFPIDDNGRLKADPSKPPIQEQRLPQRPNMSNMFNFKRPSGQNPTYKELDELEISAKALLDVVELVRFMKRFAGDKE